MNELTTAAPQALDLGGISLRLLIDLVAIAALAVGLYYRRHRRRDLVTVYTAFNVGVFIVVIAISVGQIAVAVGFGLFAVLAMIRLRSEPYSHAEFAYFFLALVIALSCGVDLGSLPLTMGLCALALATALVVDHPRLLPPIRRIEVCLELVFTDHEALRRHLEERLCARVIDATVVEIDYVREVTRTTVLLIDRPAPAGLVPDPTLDAPLETLARVVERLGDSHRVLTIGDRTRFEYRTTYFDSPDLASFREHVQGRRRRFKCRTRHYVESDERQFEVKLKGPRGRTLKRRIPIEAPTPGPLADPALGFLRACLAGYGRTVDAAMAPALSMSYHRTTVASPERGERLTCDVGLRVAGADGAAGRLREGFAIVESKSATGRARADRALLALGARPVTDCSKYCVGIGLTRPQVRGNRFHPLLRRYFVLE